MKKLIRTVALFGLVSLAALAHADPLTEVTNIKASAAEDKHPISLANMQRAIYDAADNQDWKARMIGKQKMELVKESHGKIAKIAVDYTDQELNIRLIDSVGLAFDAQTHEIDGKFNEWLAKFTKELHKNLADSNTDDSPAELTPASPITYSWSL